MNNNLESARFSFREALPTIALNYLANFAKSDNFWQDFESAFGRNYDKKIALDIKNNLASNTLASLEIVVVNPQVLGTANAAYAAQNNTIYISKYFLDTNNSQRIAATLIEEIGHSIDSQINTKDSTGDEGQIFSSLVRGEKLTTLELAGLKAENDHAVITIDSQKLEIEQAAGSIDYGDALYKSILFYDAQRSGDLPANNRVSWRGDSALNDGSDVGRDLSGGYYDAGDRVKFGLPMASSMTMLSWGAIQYRPAYQQSGQLDEVMAAIKWGTDYLLKAHVVENGKTTAFWGQVGAGNIDHNYWGAPENMTMARPSFKIDATHPGSDLAGESAAALAAASILFRSTDVNYANKLLENAKQLFAFAKDSNPNQAGEQRGNYSDSITAARGFYDSSEYEDELGWGAIWLYKATKAAGAANASYLSDAQNYYSLAELTSTPTQTWTQSWGDKSYGGMVLMAQELPGTSHYKTEVEKWLTEWTTKDNTGSVKYTPGGLAWLGDWGSLRYTANTAFIAGVYADTVNDPNQKYSNFSRSQIEYILGKNPTGISYMVGFGDKYPQRVHHAAASGLTGFGSGIGEAAQDIDNKYDIIGGLVGGPTAPTDDIDDSRQDPNDPYKDVRLGDDANGQPAYKGNEVTLDYNAGFTGALARLYGINNPISNITLAVAAPTVTEDGTTNLVYTFTRTGSITNALTVNYGVGGTATLGTDYIQTGAASFSATTGTVTFAAGATTATVTINPTPDSTIEANETVILTLTNGTGYKVGSTSNSLVLLRDNFDAENNRSGAYNYSSLTNWNVTDGSIDLLGTGFEQNLLPNNGLYLDLDGTIINGGNGGRLESKTNFSFNAGEVVTLKFSLAGSQRDDSNSVTVSLGSIFNETFIRDSSKPFELITRSFTVTAATNGKLIFDHSGGDNLGLLLDNVDLSKTTNGVTGTIVNDDTVSTPTISIADTTIIEGINGNPTQSLITVSLNKANSQAISVNYSTSDGTAIASTDYTATTGTLTFAAGQTSRTIAVPIVNNNLNEVNETFKINLTTPTNATIVDNQSIVTISDTLVSSATTILPTLVENLTLTGTSAINATGNAGNNVLTGNSAGNTYFYDADLAQGKDTINETTTGGIDTLNLSQTAAAININLGLTTAQTVNANLQLVIPVIAIENLVGGTGNDRITGNILANNLQGGSGDDRISGAGGDDTISGGVGSDIINGGAGNDTINGGAGADNIIGGAGNDIFHYNGLLSGAITSTALFGLDTIVDFTSTQDKIYLSKATFGAITSAAGTAIGSNFVTVDDDSQVATQTAKIVYSLNSGGLFYNQNGATAGLGTNGGEFANLLASPTLLATDFVVAA